VFIQRDRLLADLVIGENLPGAKAATRDVHGPLAEGKLVRFVVVDKLGDAQRLFVGLAVFLSPMELY